MFADLMLSKSCCVSIAGAHAAGLHIHATIVPESLSAPDPTMTRLRSSSSFPFPSHYLPLIPTATTMAGLRFQQLLDFLWISSMGFAFFPWCFVSTLLSAT
jgi:hypothetical protein